MVRKAKRPVVGTIPSQGGYLFPAHLRQVGEEGKAAGGGDDPEPCPAGLKVPPTQDGEVGPVVGGLGGPAEGGGAGQ